MRKNLSDVGVVMENAIQVWQAIGGDILRTMQECGEEPVVDKADVVEVVLESFDTFATPEARAIKQTMPRDAFRKTVAKAFTCARYGF